MKDRILSYLHKQSGFLYGVALCMAVFGISFVLFRADPSVFFYSTQLIFFLMIVTLVARFFRHQQEESVRQKYEEAQETIRSLENRAVQDRNATQEYFLLWVHQMKTPITAALLLAEEESDPLCRGDAIRLELLRIESYTNMAMNYLKLKDTATDLEFAEIELDEILRGLFKHFSPFFFRNRIRLRYTPTEAVVLTDGKWLRILIEQILSNATKYTKQGSISVFWEEDTKSLCIADTGIGIHARDLPKIFDRGYSGTNGRLHEKSSGLGLFLVHEINRRLGHEIVVTSEVGEGTQVRVVFSDAKMTKL